uniref:Protein TAP1-like n=1 Tax=Nicotiana sylvestris TaxID=4096 RepID=A0A1U7WBH5_NICSY|nr:PREDICTED: protein TAP1-like [Nicotiana sylvestris]
MAKKIEANIIPILMAILMLMLISTSQVSCKLNQKCFRDCIRACYQNPGCYKMCGLNCDESRCGTECQDSPNTSSPMQYCNIGCSIHNCASLIKDDKQWRGCMKDCSNKYCKIRGGQWPSWGSRCSDITSEKQILWRTSWQKTVPSLGI